MILADFPLEWTGFFPGMSTYPILADKMQDFRNFVLHNCNLILTAEQVYLKLQLTNVKEKEDTANPKHQTLEKIWSFENPKP